MYCVRCGFEIVTGDSTEQGIDVSGENGRAHQLAACFDLVNQDRKLYRDHQGNKGQMKAFYEAHPDGASPRPVPPEAPKKAPEPLVGKTYRMQVMGEDTDVKVKTADAVKPTPKPEARPETKPEERVRP